MKDIESKTIWEQYESAENPRVLAQNKIMQQDLEDEQREGSGYTDTGFEELQHDLKDAMSKALKIDAVLPNEKKGDDYAEVHHNLMMALKNFIEEIDIKINN